MHGAVESAAPPQGEQGVLDQVFKPVNSSNLNSCNFWFSTSLASKFRKLLNPSQTFPGGSRIPQTATQGVHKFGLVRVVLFFSP